MGTRPRRHRGGARLEPAAGRPVGLADDEQLVGEVRQALEQGNADRTRAEERDATDPGH
jgi:hypothetical protein